MRFQSPSQGHLSLLKRSCLDFSRSQALLVPRRHASQLPAGCVVRVVQPFINIFRCPAREVLKAMLVEPKCTAPFHARGYLLHAGLRRASCTSEDSLRLVPRWWERPGEHLAVHAGLVARRVDKVWGDCGAGHFGHLLHAGAVGRGDGVVSLRVPRLLMQCRRVDPGTHREAPRLLHLRCSELVEHACPCHRPALRCRERVSSPLSRAPRARRALAHGPPARCQTPPGAFRRFLFAHTVFEDGNQEIFTNIPRGHSSVCTMSAEYRWTANKQVTCASRLNKGQMDRCERLPQLAICVI